MANCSGVQAESPESPQRGETPKTEKQRARPKRRLQKANLDSPKAKRSTLRRYISSDSSCDEDEGSTSTQRSLNMEEDSLQNMNGDYSSPKVNVSKALGRILQINLPEIKTRKPFYMNKIMCGCIGAILKSYLISYSKVTCTGCMHKIECLFWSDRDISRMGNTLCKKNVLKR